MTDLERDDAALSDGLRLTLDRPEPPPVGSARWNAPLNGAASDDAGGDGGDEIRPLTALVSFHFLRAAVRRRWHVCALTAALGLFLGVCYLQVVPALPTATATLMLGHDQQVEASRAIATDVSFLASRTVAERTIMALGLTMDPEDLMESVEAVPSSSAEILQLTLTAPTGPEAIRRIDRFSKEYLNFRARQISAQSDILIQGYNDRVSALQVRARTLSTRIQALSADGGSATDRLSDAITERSQLNSEIARLQSTAQDVKLQQAAIVSTSRVIDPPAIERQGRLRRPALALLSGLIGGAAAGLALVALQAVLSDRLRLRVEVAAALDAPVPLSVRRTAPLGFPWRQLRFLPWVARQQARRTADREHLARTIRQALPERAPGRPQRLGVLCLDGSGQAAFGVVAAALASGRRGGSATVVDLTEAGSAGPAWAHLVRSGAGEPAEVEVRRPAAVPSSATGPTQLDLAGWGEPTAATGHDGALILADLDPAVGVDHLTAWTDRVVLVVTGGRSSVELVRTAGDLVRAAGLELHGAVLVDAVRDDRSSGMPARPADDRAPAGCVPGGHAGR